MCIDKIKYHNLLGCKRTTFLKEILSGKFCFFNSCRCIKIETSMHIYNIKYYIFWTVREQTY